MHPNLKPRYSAEPLYEINRIKNRLCGSFRTEVGIVDDTGKLKSASGLDFLHNFKCFGFIIFNSDDNLFETKNIFKNLFIYSRCCIK